tara:strand:+ start:470 stop:637 length:168 start_codon:yes stop_codon:yes gene_type:complete
MEDITKEMFDRFVSVQESGVCNMMDSRVLSLANLTKKQHMHIICNYEAIEKRLNK